MVKVNREICSKCSVRIPYHHPKLHCDICSLVKHAKCEKLTKNEAKHIVDDKLPWTCKECINDILPINACNTRSAGQSQTSFKIQCTSCNGWSYSQSNVRTCSWCDRPVHINKCYKESLGCLRCCENLIPGYHVTSYELNDDYSALNNIVHNPYHQSHISNQIGNAINEEENASEHWTEISNILINCKYTQQKHIKSTTPVELKIFSLNIRSLIKNISQFKEDIITYNKYDILCFNECNLLMNKLPNGINDILLEGFHDPILQEPVRSSGRGGGLAIYINKRVCDAENIESFVPNSDIENTSGEFQFVKIHNCKGFNKTKIIANVYRSPSRSVDNFNKLLDTILRNLDIHSRKHIIVTGDFNIDLIKYQNGLNCQNLIEIMSKYGFVQLVSRPTRVTDHSQTLIDHVYVNQINNTLSCNVLTVDISDHLATLTTIALGSFSHSTNRSSNSTRHNIETRMFNEANNLRFKELIEEENWDDVCLSNDAELRYEKFCEIYTNHYNEAYPLKNNRVRRNNERVDPKPFMLPWLEDACARKQNLFHVSVSNPTVANISAYKKMNKFCEKHVNKAKDKYYKNYFDKYSNCSKKQWQIINKLLNRKVNASGTIKLKDSDGNIMSTNTDVAEKFNAYFSSIASNLKENMRTRLTFDPGGFHNFLHNSCTNSMYIKPVDASEVFQVINKFQNKSTLDTKIGPLKIANCSSKFTETLAKVVNSSFEQGIFPKPLKTARVIPIHKEGSKTEVSNYRPISLLSSFSKIYEKLMHTRVLDFLDSNNSLFENQYGFRPGRSCEHALLNAQNTIIHSLNKKEIALLLLIDYSKAFDVLEHSILLHKLQHYGIRGIALKWFESYLSGRNQFVTINNTDSSAKDITYGVPQGSILGPLLFVIYINDLPGISNVAKFILYADDANIIVTGSNMHEVVEKINTLIHNLVNWVNSNGLVLNLKKTKYMIFAKQHIETSDIEIRINGTKIERKTEARFLGVIVDEKLLYGPTT